MSELLDQARHVLELRWQHNGRDYAEPVPAGVVELGDWASEHLPELIAEVELGEAAIRRNERNKLADLLDRDAGAITKYLADPADAVRFVAELLRLDQ